MQNKVIRKEILLYIFCTIVAIDYNVASRGQRVEFDSTGY